MTENKEIEIIDLNYYCLIEIVKYLNFEDLVNLKAAHNAFGKAVDYAVAKGNCWVVDTYWCDDDNENAENTVKKISKFFVRFQNKLKRLDILLLVDDYDDDSSASPAAKQSTVAIKH